MRETSDRQTSNTHHCLMPPWWGHNNNNKEYCYVHGMLQSLQRWQTPTSWPLHPQLAPQLRWWHPENKRSTPRCQGRTCSSKLLWKLWAQSTNGCAILKWFGPQSHFCLCWWYVETISLAATLYHSVEIQCHLAAWVVWKWCRPGPLADQFF